MWVSSLANVLTVNWITREGFGIARIRIGKVRPYITAALVVPACFAATYALTWLLGPTLNGIFLGLMVFKPF